APPPRAPPLRAPRPPAPPPPAPRPRAPPLRAPRPPVPRPPAPPPRAPPPRAPRLSARSLRLSRSSLRRPWSLAQLAIELQAPLARDGQRAREVAAGALPARRALPFARRALEAPPEQ